MSNFDLLAHEEPFNPNTNSSSNPNTEPPYKSVGSEVNFILKPLDQLHVHQDPLRHTHVKFGAACS